MAKGDIIITITMREEGNILVAGPMLSEGSNLFDKPLVYYMLEEAKDIIKLHNKLVSAKKVLTPSKAIVDGHGQRLT